ncbi:hypothetical protein BU25DRAFT_329821, partial [Macroventuria anomochaeta]
ARLPVRSALFKQRTGGLVVRWVTTSEYPLLYVFAILLFLCCLYRRRPGLGPVRMLLALTIPCVFIAVNLL